MLKAYTDGACRVSNPGMCSCAFVVYDDDRFVYEQGYYLGPEPHSNNYAEYAGLLKVLKWLNDLIPDRSAIIYCDSTVVVKQVTGEWKCSKPDLMPLKDEAQALMVKGKHMLRHVRGHSGIAGNERADKICNEVLDKEKMSRHFVDHEKMERERKAFKAHMDEMAKGWDEIKVPSPLYSSATSYAPYPTVGVSGSWAGTWEGRLRTLAPRTATEVWQGVEEKVSREFHEKTGINFYHLTPTEQRKYIEAEIEKL